MKDKKLFFDINITKFSFLDIIKKEKKKKKKLIRSISF